MHKDIQIFELKMFLKHKCLIVGQELNYAIHIH